MHSFIVAGIGAAFANAGGMRLWATCNGTRDKTPA